MRKPLCAVVSFMVAAAAAASEPPSAPSKADLLQPEWTEVGALRIPEAGDRETAKLERAAIHAWLLDEQVAAGVERPLVVHLTPEEIQDLELGRCEACVGQPRRLRVGVAKPVAGADPSAVSGWGAGRETADGGWVWSAAVRSDAAYGIRLHFEGLRLAPNVELYLFNQSGQVAGPYTGGGPREDGDFWSHMVVGETVFLQLRQYGSAVRSEGPSNWFEVTSVGHISSRLDKAMHGAKSFCEYNAECIFNVRCAGAPPAVDDARDAVAHMLFVDEPYLYACSGGLLNNTANDGTPYFLTANHCLSTDAVAETLEAFFLWSVPCGSTCPEQWAPPVDGEVVLGAEVVATNRRGDYTLLLLDAESPPAGTALLGWTSMPVAFANGELLYRVSHPSGAPQAYSEHRVDVDARTCLFWPRGSSIYSRDILGATEGGSSGSPVVNGDGLVVGQLTGACGLLAWLPCLSNWHATVDGAFASYFDEVAPWLAPPGGCDDDADGDGFISRDCGGDDCDDGDFLVNPGAAEVCDNAVDDDCDGAVDGDDPDCGLCLAEGEACTSNADCCSRWCRWFGRTCR
jgi:hypothetical protein